VFTLVKARAGKTGAQRQIATLSDMGKGSANPTADAPPVTLWLTPEQGVLGSAVLPALALLNPEKSKHPLRVGSSTPGVAADLSAKLGGQSVGDDLRAALASAEPGIFLIGAPGPFASLPDAAQRLADCELLESCAQRGVTVVSLEPMPASLIHLVELHAEETSEPQTPVVALGPSTVAAPAEKRAARIPLWCGCVPLLRFCEPVAAATDLLEQFGPVRGANVVSCGPSWGGSLGARLFDALDVLTMFMGEPDSVHASHVFPPITSPNGGGGAAVLRPLPGVSLRDLQGDLSAMLRFPGARSASIFASSNAPDYSVRVTLLGPGGRLTIGTHGLEWINAQGVPVDRSAQIVRSAPKPARTRSRSTKADASSPASEPSALALLIADQMSRMSDPNADLLKGARSSNASAVLATAQAALLSCRTGEGESPATMQRMAGG
jgi:hypothetical protein